MSTTMFHDVTPGHFVRYLRQRKALEADPFLAGKVQGIKGKGEKPFTAKHGLIIASSFNTFLVKLRAEIKKNNPWATADHGLQNLCPIALYEYSGGERGYGRRFWCGTLYANVNKTV